MEKLEFQVDHIYRLMEYKDKIKLHIIATNRNEKKQIEAKLESCENVGMQVAGIFTPSQIVQEAGYPLIDAFTGEKASDEDIAVGFTIVEGNTRFRAWKMALEKKGEKNDYNVFDYIFTVRYYPSAEDFQNTYRRINIDNVPTKTKDFTQDLLATSQNKILSSYNSKIGYGLVAKAAGIATVNQEILKDDLVKCFQGRTPKILSDEGVLVFTDPVYEATLRAFSSEKRIKPILKGTAVWKFNAAKLTSVSIDQRDFVMKLLLQMYDNLSARTFSLIMDAKSDGNRTKEQVVFDILEKAYQQVAPNNP